MRACSCGNLRHGKEVNTTSAMSTTTAYLHTCRAGFPVHLLPHNRAPTGSRLGFLRRAPHLIPLEQTRRGGGTIPATVLVVHRKFPVLYMASAGEGVPRTPRTPRAQEQAEAASAAQARQVRGNLLNVIDRANLHKSS